ncbi:MAG: putative phosphohistidine phosphatase, SixA [Acidobacteria bacterium]|nr:putative phosphohistidine phosphatase, SixA [Acidobacteriota bacterium]
MRVYLVHHGVAVGPEEDPRRPLSAVGLANAARVAGRAAALGAKPDVVWHSGKLRAKQTAQEFWRACNALAEFAVTKDLQPDDPPQWMRDRLRAESRDIAIAGHFPHLPRLLALLTTGGEAGVEFPINGVVALVTDDEGETWRELWRIDG